MTWLVTVGHRYAYLFWFIGFIPTNLNLFTVIYELALVINTVDVNWCKQTKVDWKRREQWPFWCKAMPFNHHESPWNTINVYSYGYLPLTVQIGTNLYATWSDMTQHCQWIDANTFAEEIIQIRYKNNQTQIISNILSFFYFLFWLFIPIFALFLLYILTLIIFLVFYIFYFLSFVKKKLLAAAPSQLIDKSQNYYKLYIMCVCVICSCVYFSVQCASSEQMNQDEFIASDYIRLMKTHDYSRSKTLCHVPVFNLIQLELEHVYS